VFRRIDRYVLSELVGPLGLGLLVYTFILLVQTFFRLAEMIIQRGLPAGTVGKLLLYSLPNIIVLTIPMSLLLAVLLGIGRLASDSELIALRASGISLYRILRPVLLLALVLAGVNTYLMLDLLPRGNTAHVRLSAEILTRTLGAQFEPRIFYNEFPGKILYVADTDARGEDWRGVFLGDSIVGPEEPADVWIADRGALELSSDGEEVALRLRNAVQHSWDIDQPDRYETRRHENLRLVLKDTYASEQRARAFSRKSERSMNWAEVSAAAVDPDLSAQQRRAARVQMHKMFSIPAACLVFAILALPLAFTNRRGGKSSGFAASIGIVVVYYVLINQGEQAAIAGKISPLVAMWLPNAVLGLCGLLLLVQRNRDRPVVPRFLRRSRPVQWIERGALRLVAWVLLRAGLRRRRSPSPAAPAASTLPGRRAAAATGARVVVRLPRLQLRVLNLIDRYVLKLFFAVFLLVIASCVAILSITDLTENVDDVLKNAPPPSIVFRYYKYLSLQLAYDIAPIAVLVTTLVTFSLLARSNEITACRALGISIYRLALPAFLGAVAIGALFAGLQAKVLPASNRKVAEAKAVIRGQPPPRLVRSADRHWQMGRGRFMYNFLFFDESQKSLQRLQVFEFDDRFHLVARLFAKNARFEDGGWTLDEGWTRTFDGRRQLDYEPFSDGVRVDLSETPEFFADEMRRPDQMGYRELAGYSKELRESGRPQPRYEVALYNKIAFPIGAVVMAMVGFPFAFRIERRGALYGLGISIALGVVFVLVYAFFRTLGEVGALPPIVAVWSPSLLFSLFGTYLFLGVRT